MPNDSLPARDSLASCGTAGFIQLALLVTPVLLVPGWLAAQSRYQSFDEAWAVGVARHNAKNYAAAQEPFEAALELTTDVKNKVKVYSALMASYRLLPETDKMLVAAEYVITHHERDVERSLTRTSLLSYLYQRGKIDDALSRYENKLRAEPQHRTALFILSEIYVRQKENPERAIETMEKLAALDKQDGKKPDARFQAELARQYVLSKKYKEGAERYEQVAAADETNAARHWKEAAAAWLKEGDKAKALAAAKKSETSKPESGGELLEYFLHKGLADVFLEAGEPASAIPHYEKAIAKTKIEGYRKDCEKKLAEAKQKAGK